MRAEIYVPYPDGYAAHAGKHELFIQDGQYMLTLFATRKQLKKLRNVISIYLEEHK